MGLLGGGFDTTNANEDEFNEWYDTEHVPERLRIAGFINGVRWIGAANPKISLALYDLESLAVLQKPEYKAVSPANFSPWATRLLVRKCKRLCRFNCDQLGTARVAPSEGEGLLVFATNVVPEVEDEFNAWYDTEHVPNLSAVPGVLCARRFRSPSADGHKYVATYHLTAPAVCESEAWKQAAYTPWTRKLGSHFRDSLRLVLRRYHQQPRA